eukprot:7549217-Karenia_brevis.AAC.1
MDESPTDIKGEPVPTPPTPPRDPRRQNTSSEPATMHRSQSFLDTPIARPYYRNYGPHTSHGSGWKRGLHFYNNSSWHNQWLYWA